MATTAVSPQQAGQLMTVAQFQTLSVAQQMAYINSLPAANRAMYQSAMASGVDALNKAFMMKSIPKRMVCLQTSGSALSQSYQAGNLLTFTVPFVNNGYVKGIWIRAQLTGTLATGTSAAYALNAGFPLNLFQDLEVIFGRTVHKFSPYILDPLKRLNGFLRVPFYLPNIGGLQNATLASYRSSQPFTANTGANTWNFQLYVPFNFLHPSDVRGIIPVYDNSVQCQINLICATQSLGYGPAANPVAATTGSGQSVAVTGTVAVYADIVDGTNTDTTEQLRPYIDGLPSVRIMRDTQLNNITGGSSIYKNKISVVGKHAYYVSTIVDANQSNKFAANTNISTLSLGKDQSDANLFYKYGVGTNMSVYEFFDNLYHQLGQDLPEGIIPWITGPIDNIADASLLEGAAYLNTTPVNGWTNANIGVQVGSTGGVSGLAPYVESHGVLLGEPLQIVKTS